MSFKGIIFDMDGVLVDSEPVHLEATRLLLADHGIAYAPADEEDFVGCTDREVFHQLKERYRLRAGELELARAWIERVVALLPGRIAPMPGVPAVLQALKAGDRRLALASSSAPPIIRTTIAGLGLDGMFEATVSGHDVPHGKPAPDIFLEAARRIDLDPRACLVVEDSSNGLKAARAAGIPCVVIPCETTRHQDFGEAAGRLASLEDLPAWIAGAGSRENESGGGA